MGDGLDVPWALPECRYFRLTMSQDRDSAAQGLPPEFELQGEGVATLVLLAADCPAAVVGNTTVVTPFRYAVVYHLLRAMSDHANQVDTFAREIIVTSPVAAQQLSAAGLAATVGEVSFTASGEPHGLTVSSPGLQYVASGLPAAQGPAPDTGAYSFRYGTANDARAVWLQDEVSRTSRSDLPDAVTLQVEGGYLGEALPGGVGAARFEESSGSAVWTLLEEVYS
jgi:hypothetical protein